MRIWGRKSFRGLSRPSPNAQDLFVSFIIGPLTGALPGLFVAGPGAIAESMGWIVDEMTPFLRELQDAGMLLRDDECNLNFLPGAMEHNAPGSWQHLTRLGREFDGIPESGLKERWIKELAEYCVATGKTVPPVLIPLVPIEYRESMRCKWDAYVAGRRKKEEGRRKMEDGIGKVEEEIKPQEPRSGEKERKDREDAQTVAGWIEGLMNSDTPRVVVERYVKESMGGIEAYFEKRGGTFTARRRGEFARGMRRLSIQAQLAAMEIYIDGHAGRYDHSYLLGIARKNQDLTDAELGEKVKMHRRQNRDGVFSAA